MREEFENKARKRTGRPQTYRVLLTEREREQLMQVAEEPAKDCYRWRAKVLLALDEGEFATGERQNCEQIADAYGICPATVYRTAKRFTEESLNSVLNANVTGAPFTVDEELQLRDLVNAYDRESKPWSIKGLAKDLGRGSSTIHRAIHRLAERGEILFPRHS